MSALEHAPHMKERNWEKKKESIALIFSSMAWRLDRDRIQGMEDTDGALYIHT